jgi:hypothetical protein
MDGTLAKVIATAALVGTLVLPVATPTQAAEGRNAAFAAGVAAGVIGGALVAPRPAYPAYGVPAYGYPAYGPGYYAGPRVVRPYPP